MPARWAASDFSLRPPIGSTWPVRVTSPVIATSFRTGRFEISEASAVAIAMPAEGPSFGTAPAGTWTWMSWLANQSSGRSGARSLAWARTQERAACADSFITSPSCPAIVSLPGPGTADRRPGGAGGDAGVLRPASLLGEEAPLAEQLTRSFGGDPHLAFDGALGHLARNLPADRA